MSETYVNKVLGWREEGTPDQPYWKSITQAERDAAPTHCGPHGSFPLGPGCAHVSAAFHLSGHGHPSMGCIKSYAKSHGCDVPETQKAGPTWRKGQF